MFFARHCLKILVNEWKGRRRRKLLLELFFRARFVSKSLFSYNRVPFLKNGYLRSTSRRQYLLNKCTRQVRRKNGLGRPSWGGCWPQVRVARLSAAISSSLSLRPTFLFSLCLPAKKLCEGGMRVVSKMLLHSVKKKTDSLPHLSGFSSESHCLRLVPLPFLQYIACR